jgi:hypothetical protein
VGAARTCGRCRENGSAGRLRSGGDRTRRATDRVLCAGERARDLEKIAGGLMAGWLQPSSTQLGRTVKWASLLTSFLYCENFSIDRASKI